jgi:carbon-monoxide dehydrogenase small subunit
MRGERSGLISMFDVTLKVNGEEYEVSVPAKETLLNVLRDRLGFLDVKCSCNEGECGACTVLLNGKAVCSCLMLAVQAEGKAITTIGGIAKFGELHPLQKNFIEYGAIQCGYCTPGLILTAKAFLDENPEPTEAQVREAISGNLCRCTGYQQIVEAIIATAAEVQQNPTTA